MNSINTLVKQTADAYQWTHKLIDSIPREKWEIIPDVLESNVSWQIGHLLMSWYYHSIMVIAGHQKDIVESMPLKTYQGFFSITAPINSVGKVNIEELYNHLQLVEKRSLSIIQSLSLADLEKDLEPMGFPHPLAKNKYEALDWNIKHTMWHCGQISMLKRIVDKRYDFGLKQH